MIRKYQTYIGSMRDLSFIEYCVFVNINRKFLTVALLSIFLFDRIEKKSLCEKFGDKFENKSETANTACCVCNGGNTAKFNPSPSSVPSYVASSSHTLSFSPVVTSSSPNDKDELNALKELFNATNGTGWINSQNWLSDESVCDWHGVGCNHGKNYVTTLSLPKNGLAGAI